MVHICVYFYSIDPGGELVGEDEIYKKERNRNLQCEKVGLE